MFLENNRTLNALLQQNSQRHGQVMHLRNKQTHLSLFLQPLNKNEHN